MLWATARFDLGLSDEEFGRLNFRLLHALMRRKQMADREAFLRAGIVAAQVINFSPCHPDERVEPTVFVPKDPEDKTEDFDLRRLSPEEQKQYIIDMFSAKKMTR